MYCHYPFKAFKSKEKGRNGGRLLTTDRAKAMISRFENGQPQYEQLKRPCGQCEGCRLRRAKEWSFRLMHELESYRGNAQFLTLTYNERNIPKERELVHEDVQKFIKKLRRRLQRKTGKNPDLRYFLCGEYGEKTFRPHYHMILYGHKFEDLKPVGGKDELGNQLKMSPTLEKIWGLGFCSIGEVTLQSCGYVARYILKKLTGEAESAYFNYPFDKTTGENIDGPPYRRKPPYVVSSTGRKEKRGIGYRHCVDNIDSIIKHDSITTFKKVNGVNTPIEMQTPRYYLKIIQELRPGDYEKLIIDRIKKAKEAEDEELWLDEGDELVFSYQKKAQIKNEEYKTRKLSRSKI